MNNDLLKRYIDDQSTKIIGILPKTVKRMPHFFLSFLGREQAEVKKSVVCKTKCTIAQLNAPV